jgi:hypothetical protein
MDEALMSALGKRPRVPASPAQDGGRAPRKLKVLTWTDQFIHVCGRWRGIPEMEAQPVEGQPCRHGENGGSGAKSEVGIRPKVPTPCLESTLGPARAPQEDRLRLRRTSKEMTATNGVEANTVLSKGKERGNGSSHIGRGVFFGLDLQHGPLHSDHMEEKMRYSGYWEMRNEKLKEQGAALRVSGDAGARAMASVYRNLAKRFGGADGEEREDRECAGFEGEKMPRGGGGEKTIEAKAVTSWETSCGHLVKLARPKAEVANSDAFVNRWQVRVSGPSILEAGGFKKMTCKANVDDALKKAAKYLKISVDDLQPRRANCVVLSGSTENNTSNTSLAPLCAPDNTSTISLAPLGAPTLQPISNGMCVPKLLERDSPGRGCLAEATDSAIFHGKNLYFDGRTGSHSSLHLSKLVMLYGGCVSVALSKRSFSLAPLHVCMTILAVARVLDQPPSRLSISHFCNSL